MQKKVVSLLALLFGSACIFATYNYTSIQDAILSAPQFLASKKASDSGANADSNDDNDEENEEDD